MDRLKMYFLLEMGYSIAMLAYQRVSFTGFVICLSCQDPEFLSTLVKRRFEEGFGDWLQVSI